MRILHLLTLILVVSIVFMIMALDMTHSYGKLTNMLGYAVRPLNFPMMYLR